MSLRGKLSVMGIDAANGQVTNFPNGIAVAGDTVSTGQGVAVTDADAATSDSIDVTFTTNPPTPSEVQTISNGTIPTVAELGQWVANQEVVCAALEADNLNLRTQLNALLASLRTAGTIAT